MLYTTDAPEEAKRLNAALRDRIINHYNIHALLSSCTAGLPSPVKFPGKPHVSAWAAETVLT